MYIPEIFQIKDLSVIEKFIHENGFATIISKGDTYPLATHIPLELTTKKEGQKVLWGHIAKANLQGKDIEKNPDVLAIFMSPLHSYISSSWYFHENAPTWNYMSVHVTGTAKIMEEKELWESVSGLTKHYEKASEHPVSLEGFSAATKKQMKYITGIEIAIHKMEAAFKLSQNRNQKDFENILHQLRKQDNAISHLLADAMEQQSRIQLSD